MKKGFTLVEIMTAISLFIIVMTISMGSIISVFDADRKSKSVRAVLGNLNLAVETMAREMRFGKNYHCGEGTITTPQNCPSGDDIMGFLSSDDLQIVYRQNGSVIEKSTDNEPYVAVTAPEVTVESLTFYVLGAGTANQLQPKVLISVKGTAGVDEGKTDFAIQTLVSQRVLDKLDE